MMSKFNVGKKPEKNVKPDKKKPERKGKPEKKTNGAMKGSDESAIMAHSENKTSKTISGSGKPVIPLKYKVALGVLALIGVALIIGIGAVVFTKFFNGSKRSVCTSPKCVQLAHRLNNWRDPNVDPCVDFYKATCGNFIEHSLASDTHLKYQKELMYNFLKELLTSKSAPATKSETVMRTVYTRCKSRAEMEVIQRFEQDLEFQRSEISSFGDWPGVVPDDGSKDPFKRVHFDLNRWLGTTKGTWALFAAYPFKSLIIHEPSANFLAADRLYQILVNLFKTHKNYGFYRKWLKHDVEMATKLHRRIRKLSHRRQGRATLAELQKKVPSINFQRVLMTQGNLKPDEWGPLSKKIVVVNSELFFGEADNLEKIIQSTPNRVMANYIIYKRLSFFFNDEPTDNDSCESWPTKIMPKAVLNAFIRNQSSSEHIEQFSKMLAAVKEAYGEMFDSSNWLGGPTKEKSKRKLEMMTELVSYPNEQALDKLYEKFNLSPTGGLLELLAKFFKKHVEHSFKDIIASSPSNVYEYAMLPDSYTHPIKDHFAITVAILNDPNFNATYPKYARVAADGTTLAHEIGHGFDREGVEFDENLEWSQLMNAEEKGKFVEKTQCLVDQYGSYEDPKYGKGLDGNKTVDYMIADNLGARVAWKTHKSLDMSKEPDIVGFEGIDIDKLFFHIAAMDFCSPPMTAPRAEVLEMVAPTHSFRVNGVFANMDSFAKTYNCPAGSPMNPEKKCEIF